MRRTITITAAFLLTVVALASGASSVSATEPWLHLTSGSRPTNLAPESEGEIVLNAENMGNASIDGAETPVTLTDKLPSGLEALAVEGHSFQSPNFDTPMSCSLSKLTCVYSVEPVEAHGSNPGEHPLGPYQQLEMRIKVRVLPGASSSEANQLSVNGGGAPPATVSRALKISEEPAPYGIEDYEFRAENEGGSLDTQAGSHPYQVTGTFVFNQGPDFKGGASGGSGAGGPEPVAEPKDVIGKLPAGLLGNPRPIPTCSLGTFLAPTVSLEENACSPQTAMGVALVTVNDPGTFGHITFPESIYNLEPYAGEPAR